MAYLLGWSNHDNIDNINNLGDIMKHRMKVSVKQTKKMKKLGIASQRIELVLEMAFNTTNSESSATKAMGLVAKELISQTSLLYEYLPKQGEEVTHLVREDGQRYALEPSCFLCDHADPVQAKYGNIVCDLNNNNCDFCSKFEVRK